MGRWTRALIITVFLALPLALVVAQEPPPGGDEPPFLQTPTVEGEEESQPPAGPPITEEAQETPITIPATPLEATPTPQAALTDDGIAILTDARFDMQLLLDATRSGQPPEEWSGAADSSDPQFALLTRLDLEVLAGTLLGAEVRPDGWFGVVASTPWAVARDVRHDLELLADAVLQPGSRPDGWRAGEPLMSCDRSTQAAVRFLELNGVFELQADRTASNFCALAEIEVSRFIEVNYLANPDSSASLVVPGLTASAGDATVDQDFAVGFLDRQAVQRAGVIPPGTAIEPVARSYAQYSNMMLIRGNGFEVFVDYQFTSVTPEQFAALPDVDAVEDFGPFCQADWCG